MHMNRVGFGRWLTNVCPAEHNWPPAGRFASVLVLLTLHPTVAGPIRRLLLSRSRHWHRERPARPVACSGPSNSVGCSFERLILDAGSQPSMCSNTYGSLVRFQHPAFLLLAVAWISASVITFFAPPPVVLSRVRCFFHPRAYLEFWTCHILFAKPHDHLK